MTDEILIKAAVLIRAGFVAGDFWQRHTVSRTFCIDGAIRYVGNGMRYKLDIPPQAMQSMRRVFAAIPFERRAFMNAKNFCEKCHAYFEIQERHGFALAGVHHYNDHHCGGGEEAYEILSAASKVELNF